MSDSSFMEHFGPRLVANGYPILPIMPGTKKPGRVRGGAWSDYPDWTRHAERPTTEHELGIWQTWPDAGVGILRLRALADWHFGGGDSYCASCAQACPDCPARLSRPATFEGWQAWDLVGRLGGQLRVIPDAVIGWDMGAALGLAAALGIEPLAAAELLPEIEAVMVRRLNEAIRDSHG